MNLRLLTCSATPQPCLASTFFLVIQCNSYPCSTYSATHVHTNRRPFIPPSWNTVDDRVRGGSSHSYLLPLSANGARFHGTLDIETLGGAGFASQLSPVPETGEKNSAQGQSRSEDASRRTIAWDLGGYDGIEIAYSKGDGKVYTFIIKDDVGGGRRDDGREMASVNWEVNFKAQEDGGTVWKPWRDFRAFYRGKEKDDAGQMKTDEVRRVGLMMRRFAPKYRDNIVLTVAIAVTLVPSKGNST